MLNKILATVFVFGAIVMAPYGSASAGSGCYYNPKDAGLWPDRRCRNIAPRQQVGADYRRYPGTHGQRYVGPRGIHGGHRHGGYGGGYRRGGIILGPTTTYGGGTVHVPGRHIGNIICTTSAATGEEVCRCEGYCGGLERR